MSTRIGPEDLIQLRDQLQDAQQHLVDSERFCNALARSFEVLDLDDTDVAHASGVSRSTVNRWRTGLSLPYKHARAPIYAFLLGRVLQAAA